jgi:anti-anti-sigma regulatory factor
MWKLQKLADGEFVVLRLSGRIEGEQLLELRDVFASEAEGRNVVLDLQDVKLVDQNTVTFLAHCEASGTQLRNCPAYIREWVGREKERAGQGVGRRG